MSIYTGYVYIWYDTKAKFFYIGGHQGQVEDKYICSNNAMKAAYLKRPETFKFRVLEYVNGSVIMLREAEQKWLDMIKDEELYWTPNIYAKTTRYYNQKKISAGGGIKGQKKNRTKPDWKKGYTRTELNLRSQGLLSFIPLDQPKIKSLKTIYYKICPQCNNQFETVFKTQIHCSLSCSSKSMWAAGKGNPGFKKGQPAPNKGLPNPNGASNGKKGAAKQSAKVTGRKRKYLADGSWIWYYPE